MRTIISIKSSRDEKSNSSSILLYTTYFHLFTPEFDLLCPDTNLFQLALGFFFFTYFTLHLSSSKLKIKIIFLNFTTTRFILTIDALEPKAIYAESK